MAKLVFCCDGDVIAVVFVAVVAVAVAAAVATAEFGEELVQEVFFLF